MLLIDNQVRVQMSKNYRVTSKNRHIGPRCHFVQQGEKMKLFELKWVNKFTFHLIMKKSINSFLLLTKCQDVDAHTLILDLLPSFDIMRLIQVKSLDQHNSPNP